MNRRIRKKLHLGEFNHKGFEITCKFDPHFVDDKHAEFLDSYISFIESINLGTGGGANANDMGQFVTKHIPCRRKSNGKIHYKHESCTDEDREKVKTWFESKSFINDVVVGSLVGAWH